MHTSPIERTSHPIPSSGSCSVICADAMSAERTSRDCSTANAERASSGLPGPRASTESATGRVDRQENGRSSARRSYLGQNTESRSVVTTDRRPASTTMAGPSRAHTFEGAHKVDRTRRTRIADQGLEAHDHTREAVDPKAEGRPRRVAGGRHGAGPNRLPCLQHRLAFHHGRARPPTVAGPAARRRAVRRTPVPVH